MKKKLKLLISLLLTVIILYFLFFKIELSAIINAFKQISFKIILICLILYCFSILIASLRVRLFFKGTVSLKRLFLISSLHSMYNNILPARTGELSYVYMLRRININFKQSFGSLFIIRLFDILALLLFFFGGWLINQTSFLDEWIRILCLFFIIFLLIFILIFCFSYNISIYLIKKSQNKLGNAFINKLLNFLAETIKELSQLRKKRLFFPVFWYTLLYWVLILAMYSILSKSLGLQLPLAILFFGIVLTMLITIIPIQGMGNFGTFEGAWTIVFLLFNQSKEIVVVNGFLVHALLFIIAVFWGIFMYVTIKLIKKFSSSQ